MEQWWIHHQEKIPIFDEGDKDRVEDLTGRIPLFLRPLLQLKRVPFRETEKEFWGHKDLSDVALRVQDFANNLKRKENLGYNEWVYSCLPTVPILIFRPEVLYPDHARLFIGLVEHCQ